MWKLIFIGIVIWLAIYIFKQVVNQSHTRHPGMPQSKDSEVENAGQALTMVQCANCSVHLPRSEAFLVDSNFYCCKAHIPNQ